MLNKKVYKIYNVVQGAFYNISFNTLEELLIYVSHSQTHDWSGSYRKGTEKDLGYYNKWLDGINLTLNDTTIYHYDGKIETTIRPYTFLDPDNRIIDLRDYIEEIIAYSKSPKKYSWNRYKRYQDSAIPEFRKGPMPGIHKVNCHRGSVYRHVASFNEKKQNSDPEYFEFVRPKRRPHNLPDLWRDEKCRHNDKSWKSNSKKRKQWM